VSYHPSCGASLKTELFHLGIDTNFDVIYHGLVSNS